MTLPTDGQGRFDEVATLSVYRNIKETICPRNGLDSSKGALLNDLSAIKYVYKPVRSISDEQQPEHTGNYYLNQRGFKFK